MTATVRADESWPPIGSLESAIRAAQWQALCRSQPAPDAAEIGAAWRSFDAEARRCRGRAGRALGAYLSEAERQAARSALRAVRAKLDTAVNHAVARVVDVDTLTVAAVSLGRLAEDQSLALRPLVRHLVEAAEAAGLSGGSVETAIISGLRSVS